MGIENVLHMKQGLGETSYAMNSQLQNWVISKARPFVENAITDIYEKSLPKCLTVVDLGCSSGPNTLTVVSEVIDAIDTFCKKSGHTPPEFQIILNDLYGNDFNTIFKSIPNFIKKIRKDKGENFGPCYISGIPGSFYGRLFPSETLHFVHSSYSLHFLSQIPPGIGNTKENVYIVKNTPAPVFNAYLMQFQKDFTLFLESRSQEVVPEGRMVLILIGRGNPDPTTTECSPFWELLAKSLYEMVVEGLVEATKLDSFNLPVYHPSSDELRTLVQEQGSFSLDLMKTFDLNLDACNISGQNVSSLVRAVSESLIVDHFGEEIIEELFIKFAEHVGEYLTKERGYCVNHLMCLTKKQ